MSHERSYESFKDLKEESSMYSAVRLELQILEAQNSELSQIKQILKEILEFLKN